jgi:hypothetical protein
MGKACGIYEVKINLFRFFVGKSERNKPVENPRHRPSYNTKIILQK